jgi:hypothetical protein
MQALITPAGMLARQHRKLVEPGTARPETKSVENEDGWRRTTTSSQVSTKTVVDVGRRDGRMACADGHLVQIGNDVADCVNAVDGCPLVMVGIKTTHIIMSRAKGSGQF